MNDRPLRPWLTASVVVACAFIVSVVDLPIDTKGGLLVTVALVLVFSLMDSDVTRAFAVTLVFAALFAWLSQLSPWMASEPMARSWWPWMTVQPLTTLFFLLSLGIVVASRLDWLTFRPATAITAAAIVTLYGYGRDYSITGQRPLLFEVVTLSAAALLSFVPIERGSRLTGGFYVVIEPFIVALGSWLAILVVLNEHEPAMYLLFGWLLPTFAMPCAVAASLRVVPGLIESALRRRPSPHP